MPSEKSLEMSRPRSPTIAAAADPVSPALAESSGSATWTTERRPRERIELDAHSVEDDACMRGASRRRRLAFKAPASDDRQKRYARARPRPVIAVGTGLRLSGSARPPHRSQRALLAHWAPPLGSGVEACGGPGMDDLWPR
jgi:hypothetical protein